ncbi:MAG TPA: deoxyuridine 5'-triphosphate nucleotidohydrolase [Tissierellales bacterium]|nr:deoxyuridine 5'-triphosphate nucleotidohydrolase [Tissierellales bacterium]
MEIKIKYFSKDYPRLEKLSQGDWIDLRVDNIKEWESNRFVLTGKDKEKLASLPMLESVVKYEKGDIIKFGLGIAIELPKGYEAEIRPRSSTFKNYGLIQTNSVGTIDNSYCGDDDEWMIEFIAMRNGAINRFDRVCQFRIWKNQPNFRFEEVDKLGNKDRGGYGTTGK